MSSTRFSIAIGALAMAFTLLCAQKAVTFNNLTSSYVGNPTSAYAVDLNNDGRPDIVQDFPEYPGIFLVTLNHGDGTFASTRSYSMPTDTPYLPMAFGDFNSDGKIDIAVTAGHNDLYLFYGNGDGTFQQPPRAVSIPLPSDHQLGSAMIGAADFNHDGKLDLVVTSESAPPGAGTVWVLPGDGAGNFGAPVKVFSAPAGQWISDVLVGDFDSDNNSDIAVDYYLSDSRTNEIIQTTIHVLYGDSKLNFTDQFVQGIAGLANIGAGHLDADPQEDLFAINYSGDELMTFYGASSGRNFDVYYQTIPAANMPRRNAGYAPLIAIADLNDDGHKDLVTIAYPFGNGGTQSLVFFLSNGSRGQFTVQQWALPGTWTAMTAPMVADFNGDTKPDVAVVQSKLTGSDTGPPVQAQTTAAINGTSNGVWSNCAYPRSAKGINVCSPVSYSDDWTHFNATAASFGNIRKMELWVDGKKHTEQFLGWGQHYSYLNFSEKFPDETYHQATIYAVDVDNHLQRYDFSFSTGYQYPCPVPSTEGINVCSPAQGSTTGSTVNVEFSTKVPDASYRMELWIDGTKRYTNFNTPYMSTNVYLNPGQHRYDFYVIGANGTRLSQTVSSTSK